MAATTPRERRLLNTYERVEALAAKCRRQYHPPRFEFSCNGNLATGEYPDIYHVTLRIKGLKNMLLEDQSEHKFSIHLPINFPRHPPVFEWHTPIFHPNILAFDENHPVFQKLLEGYENVEAMRQDMNKNPLWADLIGELAGYVCLDTLQINWTPFVTLDSLIIEMGNLIRYQKFSANHPLNKAAGKWALQMETGFFPLDKTGVLNIEDTEPTLGIRIINSEKLE